jgi:hypothetical protein
MAVFHAAAAGEVIIHALDPDGEAGRVGAPVSLQVDLTSLFGQEAEPEHLRLVEFTPAATRTRPVAVQFEPDAPRSPRGTLWWLMPAGSKGVHPYRLTVADEAAPAAFAVEVDQDRQRLEIQEGNRPVLVYNHGTVPVPEGTRPHFAAGESYARGDYIHPLYGPDGEPLSDDYPPDHPHHRGLWWSWPVTRYRDQVADIWAVVGVWSRPVAVRRAQAGPVFAAIEAENVWKFGREEQPIVREEVLIRAFRQTERRRFVDVELRLTALADDVAIGGRPKAGYGGFALRAAPCQDRQITLHADPEGATPRRAWIDYSGVFAGGKGMAGVAIFEHVDNPDYPNPLHQYPQCNCVMPAYPDKREVPLSKDEPLVLKHRLWIHTGGPDDKMLADVWATYAKPPRVTIVKE